MAIGDILAGLAEASHAHETNLLSMAHDDRMQKAKLFADLAQNPSYSPEQQAWFGKAALAHATNDKAAKQYEIKDGQIKVPVEIMSPTPPPVSTGSKAGALAAPGTLEGSPQGYAQQQVNPQTVQPPTPPPQMQMRDVMQPMSYGEMTQQQAARAGAVAAAQAPAKPPQMDIGTFGQDSSGLYNKATGDVIQPPLSPKSHFEQKTGTIDNKPVVVNYDPANGRAYTLDGRDVSGKFMPKESEPSFEEKTYEDWKLTNPKGTRKEFTEWKSAQGRETSVTNADENRLQSSYQFHVSQIAALSKPIDDLIGRFGRLQDTLNQANPQADALIAPELLTVVAGGQGSGLRMNEAEIARIVGGRSQWENLKAAIQKWNLDPTAARSITSAQDAQIRALVRTVGDKLNRKQSSLGSAQHAIADAKTTEQHKQALVNLRGALSSVDRGKYPVIDPTGKLHEFDTAEQSDAFQQLINRQ